MIFYRVDSSSMTDASDGFHNILEVHYRPTWLGRLFRLKPWESSFYGRCTVWNYMPSFRRCDSFTEGWLSSLWTKHKHAGPRSFPTEHFNKELPLQKITPTPLKSVLGEWNE